MAPYLCACPPNHRASGARSHFQCALSLSVDYIYLRTLRLAVYLWYTSVSKVRYPDWRSANVNGSYFQVLEFWKMVVSLLFSDITWEFSNKLTSVFLKNEIHIQKKNASETIKYFRNKSVLGYILCTLSLLYFMSIAFLI